VAGAEPAARALGQLRRDVWGVDDEADRRWMVDRIGPTPAKVFTNPIRRLDPAAAALPRTYIRCLLNESRAFDLFAEAAQTKPGWRYRELATDHEPFITTPNEFVICCSTLPPHSAPGLPRGGNRGIAVGRLLDGQCDVLVLSPLGQRIGLRPLTAHPVRHALQKGGHRDLVIHPAPTRIGMRYITAEPREMCSVS
jgi:hypothetical protein